MLPEEIYQASQIRAIERAAIERDGVPGGELMRRAGDAAFGCIMRRYSGCGDWLVVCGPGNNGGDGYVVARRAREIGIRARVLAVAAPTESVADDAAAALQAYRDDGGEVIVADDETMESDDAFAGVDLIVDALFGIGLARAPQGVAGALIARINQADCPVVSLDLPSGLNGDTGDAFAPCVRANLTVTFIGLKLGLLTARVRDHAGEIVVED
ncbi:MAG: NAD(P)H-hydrate epimerase, partial [bacterium]